MYGAPEAQALGNEIGNRLKTHLAKVRVWTHGLDARRCERAPVMIICPSEPKRPVQSMSENLLQTPALSIKPLCYVLLGRALGLPMLQDNCQNCDACTCHRDLGPRDAAASCDEPTGTHTHTTSHGSPLTHIITTARPPPSTPRGATRCRSRLRVLSA